MTGTGTNTSFCISGILYKYIILCKKKETKTKKGDKHDKSSH